MLSDPELVATAVASMLGLSVRSDDARPSLIAYLRDKRILLILDTCEHLIEAVAALAASIFEAAPQVHILATSREALRIEGEHVYRLDALACPPDDPELTAAAVQTFPATQLFVERAAASGARLDLSDADAPIVASICRKLDGVALAIELAARRVEILRPAADRRASRPASDAAVAGSRTAPPRQKTLQATLDWSYGLLSELERMVLRRLAVFVGHFTLDAALEVVSKRDLDQSTVFGAIDSLVAKSMVATRPIGAMMRYRLLDTTRAYALEIRLDDAELAELAVRHAAYYRRWLEQTGAEWSTLSTGTERAPHFAALNNVRAALEWCFGANGDAEIGVGLAAAAAPVFLAMSLLPECHRWSRAGDSRSRRHRARRGRGDASSGRPWDFLDVHARGAVSSSCALTRGLEIAEKLCDPVEQLRLIGPLHSFHDGGQFRWMLAVAQRGEAIAKEMAEPLGIMAAQSLLGLSLSFDRKSGEARADLEATLAPASASNSSRSPPLRL